MDLHLTSTFLAGKNVLKVKRDFHDPYLWVLAQNNQIYRINSLTQAVDDYTPKFSNYSNLTFIDIAGVNDNTVFVATNATTLLEYKNGQIKVIGAADGILGKINSIGISYTDDYLPDDTQGLGGRVKAKAVIIGTDVGMCHYDHEKDVMLPRPSHVPAKVFDATYRSQVFSDLEFGTKTGTENDQYAIIEFADYTTLGGYIYYGDNIFGNNINTATYALGALDDMNEPGGYRYLKQLWGTENGIFQNDRVDSYNLQRGYLHYLPGITVNKLTSIYGLKAFDNGSYPTLTKENVIAGTDDGLYFSNSGYHTSMKNVAFFHYDGLGHKKINDVCVNATSYDVPVCEDGIWVAAVDGLYLLTHDYGAYIAPDKTSQAIQFDGRAYDVAKIDLCEGETAKMYVTPYGYHGNKLQWYRNGIEMPNESKNVLEVSNAGDYYAVLYDPCSAIHLQSNHLTVDKIAAPVFSFNYPDVINYCSGSLGALKTDDKPQYMYRWYKDNVLMDGATTASLNNIDKGGKYRVEVSACNGTWLSSKEVEIKFITIPKPVLSLDKADHCAGSEATITATIAIDESSITGWSPYQFVWYKDGVSTGFTGPSIKVTEQGNYKVQAFGCSGSLISDEKSVSFIKMEPPLVLANKPAFCVGENASLKINVPQPGEHTITWYRNGNVINSAQNKTELITAEPGDYTANVINDKTTCQASSAPYKLSFSPPPTVEIQRIAKSSLCEGEAVELTAVFSAGSVSWSTGESTSNIVVKKSGTYTATVTTPAGCSVERSEVISLFPKPVLNLPQASLCQFTNEQITLKAPDGFVSYEWNGVSGNAEFTTSKLGEVTLTVKDGNGCTATQNILVTSHCDDIHVPNTFTPNNDGINDRWVITGLEGDPDTYVQVFDRSGSQVFDSKGYSVPWDGTSKGKKLNVGVYYYLITSRAGKQVISGSVTILL